MAATKSQPLIQPWTSQRAAIASGLSNFCVKVFLNLGWARLIGVLALLVSAHVVKNPVQIEEVHRCPGRKRHHMGFIFAAVLVYGHLAKLDSFALLNVGQMEAMPDGARAKPIPAVMKPNSNRLRIDKSIDLSSYYFTIDSKPLADFS
ncbi:MAG: hypothetical protein ACXW4O_07765 [Candidatus Binatia bacterium]